MGVANMGLPSCVTVLAGCLALSNGQDYGPVSLDSLDPLTLSWNQIHWLVRDQIKEVEHIKQEHDEIYNTITGCYGLEKCLDEFDLLNIQPGSKLYELGLRKQEVRQDLIRQREQVVDIQQKLDRELRERQRIKEYEQRKIQQEAKLALDRQKEEERMRLIEAQRRASSNYHTSSSSSSSSSSFSSSSSSSRGGGYGQIRTGSSHEPGLSDNSWRSSLTFTNSTSFGPKPQVYERRYEYSSSKKTYGPYRQN